MKSDYEVRKQRRLEQLGSNHPVCVTCGEDDWRCLELHHIAGRAHGDELVPVCRNCHRKLSDDQKDHPKPAAQGAQEQAIGYLLLGLADLFNLLMALFRKHGEYLIDRGKRGSK
jgi:hypothetical protein